MPRAQSVDFYHNNKFHIVDSENYLNPLAGFNTCVMPEMTLEVAEYKEGIWTYTRKQLGNASFSDVTLTQGVTKNDSVFYDYLRRAAEGSPVRTDFQIYQFHRDDVEGMLEYTNATPSRIIRCFNALPNRVKFGSDFDASSSDVSIQEIGFVIERAEIVVA